MLSIANTSHHGICITVVLNVKHLLFFTLDDAKLAVWEAAQGSRLPGEPDCLLGCAEGAATVFPTTTERRVCGDGWFKSRLKAGLVYINIKVFGLCIERTETLTPDSLCTLNTPTTPALNQTTT